MITKEQADNVTPDTPFWMVFDNGDVIKMVAGGALEWRAVQHFPEDVFLIEAEAIEHSEMVKITSRLKE